MSRFLSFRHRGRPGWGLACDGGIVDLGARDGRPDLGRVIADGDLLRLADAAGGWSPDIALDEVSFDIPVRAPEKIICVGVNYPDRNAEYRDGQEPPAFPSLFVRFPRSFTGHGQPLVRPPESHQLDYEGEVALVIGRPGRRIAEDVALDHVAGLTLCNEGTIRDWVRHGKFNVTQGKNFDRSGAMGPWLVPLRSAAQLADIRLTTRVNGRTRQDDRTGRMVFSFARIISYVSTFTTLAPGDILVCGTPSGAGARSEPPVWLQPGDIVEVEADGLGILSNGVADEVAA